jgi:tetratricopeptide (TPR) repeat protein
LQRLRLALDGPATLALVLSAQARLARQSQNYKESQHKLLEEVRCLDRRAAEIVKRLSNKADLEKLSEAAIEGLKDDLMFIRRKQTLSSFFNVGLAAFQRGFLKTANQACQSARLQFRLHGQFFHGVFNDLILLSIKRARTSRGQQEKFEDLKNDLEQEILPRLNPDSGVGNPKLYFYGLRELAVLLYYCEETDRMIDTLNLMDHLMQKQRRVRNQWKSRVSNQRARAFWRNWVREENGPEPQMALKHAQDAFTFASGLKEKISEFHDARTLRTAIERCKRISLIDTIESLVTYGSIQVSAKQFAEAINIANAIIELSRENNPRLWAMGYLIRAEAYTGNGQLVEARQDVEKATELEKRIDHRYVVDRRKFVQRGIEDRSPLEFFFRGLEATDFKKGTYRLLGWFIDTYSKKKNTNEVSRALGISRTRLDSYREYLKENRSEPYQHLIAVLTKHEDTQRDEEA